MVNPTSAVLISNDGLLAILGRINSLPTQNIDVRQIVNTLPTTGKGKTTDAPSQLSDLLSMDHFCWLSQEYQNVATPERQTNTPIAPDMPKASLKYGRLFRQLKEFSKLSVGWAGDNSLTISNEVIGRAEHLISELICSIPDDIITNITHFGICPTSCGGIQIEIGNRIRDLDIEIDPTEQYLSVMKVQRENDSIKTEEFLSFDEKISGSIRWLLTR